MKQSDGEEKLIIAISSSALFDLSEGHRIYLNEGISAYEDYQQANEDIPLAPGDAFTFVNKVLKLNEMLNNSFAEVILLSRNSSHTGLRIFNSIEHHGLNIMRAAFCGGMLPYRYIKAFKCHLFLSTHQEDVSHALSQGVAAARLFPSSAHQYEKDNQLRIAFDGDAVIFSDQSEQIFQDRGLKAFTENERREAKLPLSGGPFKAFLSQLHTIQNKYGDLEESPIRIGLITARCAPAHERVIRTLRAWGIKLDETLFLGSLDKMDFLSAFQADIFFDDQEYNCEKAAKSVTTCHVPYGINNSQNKNG